LKGQSETKSPVKLTWSKKITVLSTFLESSFNFLSNNLKNTEKFGTVRQKSNVNQAMSFQLPETQFERTATDKIACKTHL